MKESRRISPFCLTHYVALPLITQISDLRRLEDGPPVVCLPRLLRPVFQDVRAGSAEAHSNVFLEAGRAATPLYVAAARIYPQCRSQSRRSSSEAS